jgi:putative nucleotidyltransferase with HDIG domain
MTAHQIVKISLDQLRPGMFVGNVFNERGVLLYSANTLIVDFAQIEALRRQGVVVVGINLQKGSGREMLPVEQEPQAVANRQKENTPIVEVFDRVKVQQTVEIRTSTITAVEEIMASARTGRLFSIGTVTACVESIIDVVLDEPDLLLNLCQIRSASPSVYEHSVNVAILMTGFASALGYSRENMVEAGVGGMLHDIGMIRLPPALLHRQTTCTRQESEQIKRHPSIGLEIIESSQKKFPFSIRKIIGQHHERLNGSGYPAGLRDRQIDELAFICAIVDMYDSLTAPGPQKRTFIPQEALALIFQGADDDYPRDLVEHFTKLLGIYPVGSFVKLDSGEMGIVVKNNRQRLLTPVVKVLFNAQGVRLETPYLSDLSVAANNPGGMGVRVDASLDPHSFNVSTADIFGQI